eukprot:TRINITY_DN67041_c0_g1_i1.p1 TRINITY_DN67041_c0_g1~~TRINITY_DN67041_c0_g1_i1.p1  ORF type:complete len:806 (-),score=176.31 TRINITY_DN67041_c0_g1_i1:60-2477(-)
MSLPLSHSYREQCQALKIAPDPEVERRLENQFQSTVKRLDFSSLYLGILGVQALLESLRDAPLLETLCLENMMLKDKCMPTLASVVKTLPSLTALNLANNNSLSITAAKTILQIAKSNKRIVEIELEGTGILPATIELINKYLTDNATSGAYWVSGSPRPLRSPTRASASDLPRNSYPVSSFAHENTQSPSMEKSTTSGTGERPLDMEKLLKSHHENSPGALRSSVSRSAPSLQCEQLKGTVLDFEDRINRLAAELAPKHEAKRSEFARKYAEATQALQDYFAVQQSVDVSNFDAPQLAKDLQLQGSPDRVAALIQHYCGDGKEPNEMVVRIVKLVMEQPKGYKMDDKEIRGTVSCLSKELIDAILYLHHIVATDPVTVAGIMAAIAQSDELVRRLLSKIDDAEEGRQQALENDDMHRAESFHDESIKLQTQLIKLILDRLGKFASPGDDNQLLATVDANANRALANIGVERTTAETILKWIETDQGKLAKGAAEREKSFRDLCSDFDRLEQRTYLEVHNLEQKQDAVWQDIIELLLKIRAMSEQRKATVDKYVTEREVFERQKGEYERWVAVHAAHKKELEHLSQDVTEFTHLLINLELYVKTATATIHDRIDKVAEEVNKLLFEEQKAYLKHFRRYYLTIGELLYRKEERLAEIEKMIEQNQFQLGLIRETLDPNAAMYKAHTMELTRLRDEVATKVEWLRDLGDTAEMDFQPTESALRKAGVDFLAPTIELQEQLATRKMKVADMREQYADHMREKVFRSKDDIQKQANVAKQAKTTGLSSLISPLSPRTTKTRPETAPRQS